MHLFPLHAYRTLFVSYSWVQCSTFMNLFQTFFSSTFCCKLKLPLLHCAISWSGRKDLYLSEEFSPLCHSSDHVVYMQGFIISPSTDKNPDLTMDWTQIALCVSHVFCFSYSIANTINLANTAGNYEHRWWQLWQ